MTIAAKACLGAVLLFWILHSIFTEEVRLHHQSTGTPWEEISRAQKWQAAWQEGPVLLKDTLKTIDPECLLLSILLMGATLILGVIRWRISLAVQGLPLSFSRSLEISLVAHFFNSFLLGSTGGDLVKAWYAARETDHRKEEAVITVFADRLIGLFAMLAFAFIAGALNYTFVSNEVTATSVLAVVAAMLALCTLLVIVTFWKPPEATSFIFRHLQSLPRAKSIFKSIEACRSFRNHPGFILKTFAISTLLTLVCVLQFLVIAQGLEIEVGIRLLLFIVPAVICISALPITPSGLGVRENLMVLLLTSQVIGAQGTAALSLSLLAFGGSLVWSLVGGAVYMAFKAPHHLDEISS